MEQLYTFKPQEDITTQELAVIMQELFIVLINSLTSAASANDDKLEVVEEVYFKMPIHVQQHFTKN